MTDDKLRANIDTQINEIVCLRLWDLRNNVIDSVELQTTDSVKSIIYQNIMDKINNDIIDICVLTRVMKEKYEL